jgi:hypothetical protein
MFAWIKSLPIGLALIVCAGCAAPQRQSCSYCQPMAAIQLECRDVKPQPVAPDLSALQSNSVPERINGRFCAISEREAQCIAAKNSKTANLLAMESEAAGALRACFGDGSELSRELLVLRAAHQRNEDAATALELLLRLVEAEGGSQNLGRRVQEIEAMQTDVDHLQTHGLASPVSKSELEIQRLELRHRQADVQGTIYRLNHQLAESLGVELPLGARYGPETDLSVDPSVPNSNEAVSFGLGNRADLAALRISSQAEGREAIVAAQLMLSPLGVGAAKTGSHHVLGKLSHPFSHRREADAREDQLGMAFRQQELTVQSEVRQTADLVRTRLSQVAITRDRQHAIETRLVASQRRQDLIASPLSVRTIKLDSLAAEQDILHDVIEWKIAVVKLKQSQGLLAIECGWNTAAGGH